MSEYIVIGEESQHPLPGARVFEKASEVPDITTWMNRIGLWIPVYVNGNTSLVVLSDGTLMYVPHAVRSLYRKLAREQTVDPTAIRQAYERVFRRSLNPPLIVSLTPAIYFALRFRYRKHGRNDGVMGYFHLTDDIRIEPVSRNESILHGLAPVGVQIHMPAPDIKFEMERFKYLALILKHQGEPLYY